MKQHTHRHTHIHIHIHTDTDTHIYTHIHIQYKLMFHHPKLKCDVHYTTRMKQYYIILIVGL